MAPFVKYKGIEFRSCRSEWSFKAGGGGFSRKPKDQTDTLLLSQVSEHGQSQVRTARTLFLFFALVIQLGQQRVAFTPTAIFPTVRNCDDCEQRPPFFFIFGSSTMHRMNQRPQSF